MTTRINADFLIKAYGVIDGVKIDTLLGVSGFMRIVGDDELANRLLERAYLCGQEKKICKLRRGLKITFYAK